VGARAGKFLHLLANHRLRNAKTLYGAPITQLLPSTKSPRFACLRLLAPICAAHASERHVGPNARPAEECGPKRCSHQVINWSKNLSAARDSRATISNLARRRGGRNKLEYSGQAQLDSPSAIRAHSLRPIKSIRSR
jgi:hypothetical protein